MKYLVTGGLGFIGTHLTRALLDKGFEVTVLDDLSTGKRESLPEGARLVVGDILDATLLSEEMEGISGCYHLAAIASVEVCENEPERSHRVNFDGSVNVFETAREAGVPVVYASSAAVYGSAGGADGGKPTPINAYGADKLEAEKMAEALADKGLHAAGMRFFNVYGPGQEPSSRYSGVITRFVSRVMDGKAPVIFGDGKQERDFIHVHDVVHACVLAMEALEDKRITHEVMDICSGRICTIDDLARVMMELCHVEGEPEYREARTGDIRFSSGCPMRASELLGYSAEMTLEHGLGALCAG